MGRCKVGVHSRKGAHSRVLVNADEVLQSLRGNYDDSCDFFEWAMPPENEPYPIAEQIHDFAKNLDLYIGPHGAGQMLAAAFLPTPCSGMIELYSSSDYEFQNFAALHGVRYWRISGPVWATEQFEADIEELTATFGLALEEWTKCVKSIRASR